MKIIPLHEVRDSEKLATIAASMEQNGWQGHPVLVVDCGEYFQAITGSHRIAAAELAGVEVEFEVIEQGVYTGSNDDEVELYEALLDGGDEERYAAMVELAELGLVSAKVLAIMGDEN
jgi:hypothetical protein